MWVCCNGSKGRIAIFSSELIVSALFCFRFEYIFKLNMQSVKDCDPTKFSKEMGPHYVSCIVLPL
jgi:hypothetical protein